MNGARGSGASIERAGNLHAAVYGSRGGVRKIRLVYIGLGGVVLVVRAVADSRDPVTVTYLLRKAHPPLLPSRKESEHASGFAPITGRRVPTLTYTNDSIILLERALDDSYS